MAAKKTKRPVVEKDMYEDKEYAMTRRRIRVTKIDGDVAVCEVVGPRNGGAAITRVKLRSLQERFRLVEAAPGSEASA